MNPVEKRRWAHRVVAEAAARMLSRDPGLFDRLGVTEDELEEVRAEALELVERLRVRARGGTVCPHPAVGRWAWPPEEPRDDEPHMSVYVCARTACRRRADAAVRRTTGHAGQFVAFPSAAVRAGS